MRGWGPKFVNVDRAHTAADFPTIDTDQCWKALLKAGNGNDADIADIALQQLMNREVQDS